MKTCPIYIYIYTSLSAISFETFLFDKRFPNSGKEKRIKERERERTDLAASQAVNGAGALERATLRGSGCRRGRGRCARRLRGPRPGAGRCGSARSGPGLGRGVGSDVVLGGRGFGQVRIGPTARVGPRQAQPELARGLRLGLGQGGPGAWTTESASRPSVHRRDARFDAEK